MKNHPPGYYLYIAIRINFISRLKAFLFRREKGIFIFQRRSLDQAKCAMTTD